MRPKTVAFLLASSAVSVTAFLLGREALAKYEEPDFSVVRHQEDIEVRQYPAAIAAEVETTGPQADNQAFRILAGYIFGKNKAQDKLAMTVPVTESSTPETIAMTRPVTSSGIGTKMKMRFYMPSKYSLESLPEPLDQRVKFVQLPAVCYAVIKFSGLATSKNFARHEQKLRTYLQSVDLIPQGDAIKAFYNPPWTIPFLRRNEVWLPVKGDLAS